MTLALPPTQPATLTRRSEHPDQAQCGTDRTAVLLKLEPASAPDREEWRTESRSRHSRLVRLARLDHEGYCASSLCKAPAARDGDKSFLATALTVPLTKLRALNTTCPPCISACGFSPGRLYGTTITMTTTATALNLGWTMAQLYDHDWHPETNPPAPADDLPGIGAFSASQQTEMHLDAIDACIAALHDVLTAAGQDPLPTTANVRTLYLDRASQAAQAEVSINQLHFDIARTLAASNPNLGKSYGLGRALSDTMRAPKDQADLGVRFKHFRLETLRRWLNDLASDLPAHAAKGVLLSLSRWESWAANAAVASGEDWDAAETNVRRMLRKQGELWRAALCGEKDPCDALTADDYADAANDVARRGLTIAARVLARYGVAIAVIVAVVMALAVFVVTNPASQLVTGIGAVAAALGITWKGIGSVSEQLVLALGKPLWGSELDTAVGDGLTALPISPVHEPASDVLLQTPQYLRACAIAAAAGPLLPDSVSRVVGRPPLPGARRSLGLSDFLTTRASGRSWRGRNREKIYYWFAWAEAAELIGRDADGNLSLTPAGTTVARIPPRKRGTVRAALTAG